MKQGLACLVLPFLPCSVNLSVLIRSGVWSHSHLTDGKRLISIC